MSEQKKKLVAYHEAGHAILGALMNDYDIVSKISIVPRGPAGGVTIFMPSEERLNSGLYSKEFLENRMCVALGGRLAEEIINGKDNVTTGASNDFQQCTQVAKQMVMQLGMSPEIGQRLLGGQQQGGPFMGRDFMGQGAPPISQALKQKVDDEVKRIVDEQYQRGMKLLRDNMFLLDELAKMLMEEEKVSAERGSQEACTSEEVIRRVEEMAADVSNGSALPSHVVNSAASQALVALAAMAAPLPALADDVPPLQAMNAPQMQQQQQQPGSPLRVSGRVTYSRLLEFSLREGATTGLIEKLVSKNIMIEVHQPDKPNPLLGVLGDVAFPLLVIAGLLFLRSRAPGGGGIPGFGNQGRAKIMITPETGVKFENVAGIDEAKEELMEIVDFLKAPERFVKVGAKIPRGVLLTGPPGTGKTLMAKALAGESGVPFIQSSASEFIELFVGVGASRVRDIFKQAKEKAPCIVFIDEIDAIGRQRGAGMGGGNDEREQTLNQILTESWHFSGPGNILEMDGFEGNSGVIVVAATNRSDILDNALLRPGAVHIRNKKLEENITLTEIAQRTAGFSGADLENLMNESAILAARRNKKAISMAEINDATDRVIAGLEGRALADNSSKKLIAYHEAGLPRWSGTCGRLSW
eukprot:g14164.t1